MYLFPAYPLGFSSGIHPPSQRSENPPTCTRVFLFPDQRKYIQKKECEGAGVFSLATGFDLVLSEYIERRQVNDDLDQQANSKPQGIFQPISPS